jgi:hypothetical protein
VRQEALCKAKVDERMLMGAQSCLGKDSKGRVFLREVKLAAIIALVCSHKNILDFCSLL